MIKVKLLSLCLLFLVLFYNSKAFAIDLYGFGSYWDQNDTNGTWAVALA
jgi:hypothetical protein